MSAVADNETAPVSDAMRAALADGVRPAPPGAVANALTFGWRALLKIKHMPEQLFDVLVTPIMFTVLFTLARTVGETGEQKRLRPPAS